MKTTPIIFNAEMVRALLDGRKTQTRRAVHPCPVRIENREEPGASWHQWRWREHTFTAQDFGAILTACPYGAPGDVLWVRETWEPLHIYAVGEYGSAPYEADTWRGKVPREHCAGLGVQYKADGEEGECWRPSTNMPRWASRLTLRLTDVRVQRVQDISSDDCIAEGVGHPIGTSLHYGSVTERWNRERCFAPLWNSINAKRGHGWDANPWVWALTFDVLHANVDAVIKRAAA